MKNSGSRKTRTRQQATAWADRAMAALAEEIASRPTLFEACERAWRRAAAEWVDAEQRRTGKPVVFP
jgi:Zn-dependent oligopeptidase